MLYLLTLHVYMPLSLSCYGTTSHQLTYLSSSKKTCRRPPWSIMYSLQTVLSRQPGFDLPCRSWSLLNHFRTSQGRCLYNLHKCGLASSDLSVCGQQQTMNHMVNMCPSTKFGGGLKSLHEAGDDAIQWLESTAATALAK